MKNLINTCYIAFFSFTAITVAQDETIMIDLSKVPTVELQPIQVIDDNGQPLFYDIFTNITYDPFVKKIYLAQRAEIFVLSLDGKIIKKVGRRGQGPGEYRLIKRVDVDKDRIFVADQENARVEILNKDFSYLHSIPANGAIEDIVYEGSNQLIIHTRSSAGNILHRYDLNTPYRPKESFSEVIPKFEGILGNVLTINEASITDNLDCIYVLYRVLPILRIFCKDKKYQEVRFTGGPAETLYEKLPSSIKTSNPRAVPARIFSTRILTGKNENLYWLCIVKGHKKIFVCDQYLQNWRAYLVTQNVKGKGEGLYIDFCLSEDAFYILDVEKGAIQIYHIKE
jgi:hypothetical protein